MKHTGFIFSAALVLLGLAPTVKPAEAQSSSTAAKMMRAVLSQPESRLDFLDAATTFDRTIDRRSDTSAARAMVERLVDAARQMAGPKPTDAYKLAAVRKAIYGSGPWNYNRPFTYDQADPLGLQARSKMLSTYVRTRKGNCVSMPVLFLIVADRMGLKVRLAAAPLHLFVRYTDPAGADHNLEATSGGHEAPAELYLRKMPMSDKAIRTGLYMRTLTKRETVAQMAASVLDFLTVERRYREAADVADAMLAVNPRDSYALVKKGSAMAGMLQSEFQAKYPTPASIPLALRARYAMLAAANDKAFRDAEALGWEPGQ